MAYDGQRGVLVHDDPNRTTYGRPDEAQAAVIGRASVVPRGDKFGGSEASKPVTINIVDFDETDGGTPSVRRDVPIAAMHIGRSDGPAQKAAALISANAEKQMIPPPSRREVPPVVPAAHEQTQPHMVPEAVQMAIPQVNVTDAVALQIAQLITANRAAGVPNQLPIPQVHNAPIGESINIPELTEQPAEPKFKVEFNLGSGGRCVAWYHWIDISDGCVTLIYDGRLKYGTRYSPPKSNTPIKISITTGGGRQTYEVLSRDMTVSLGIFDMLVLPLMPTREAEQITAKDVPRVKKKKRRVQREFQRPDSGSPDGSAHSWADDGTPNHLASLFNQSPLLDRGG